MSERTKGSNNPMYKKLVSEDNKKLISKLFSKSIYLYDANTLKLVAEYKRHKDLVKAYNISSKTLIKYKNTGKVFKNKYIISSFFLL